MKGGYQSQSAALRVGTKMSSGVDQIADFRIVGRSKSTVGARSFSTDFGKRPSCTEAGLVVTPCIRVCVGCRTDRPSRAQHHTKITERECVNDHPTTSE
jgi:hypothetical protein